MLSMYVHLHIYRGTYTITHYMAATTMGEGERERERASEGVRGTERDLSILLHRIVYTYTVLYIVYTMVIDRYLSN